METKNGGSSRRDAPVPLRVGPTTGMARFATVLTLAASLGALGAVPAAAHDVTVPKGTFLELAARSAFDSDHVKKGDRFTATVTRGLRVEDQLPIPAGRT